MKSGLAYATPRAQCIRLLWMGYSVEQIAEMQARTEARVRQLLFARVPA